MKTRIVLVLLVLSVMMGLASANTGSESGIEGGDAYYAEPAPNTVEAVYAEPAPNTVEAVYAEPSILDVSAVCYSGTCEVAVAIDADAMCYDGLCEVEIAPDVILDVDAICYGGSCEVEVAPPDVGTCEYPGHLPCTSIGIPDTWIMPQWFSWRFAN